MILTELAPQNFAEDFPKVFALMEKSFPPDEFRTFAEQQALLQKEGYRIYLHKAEEQLAAFAATWIFKDFVFIENLAVQPELRNSGLGKKILQELVTKFTSKGCSCKKVILEVEPPQKDSQNHPLPEAIENRRIAFYQRNGFCLNPYDYTQPAISKGRKPIPLKIMSFGNEITPEEFKYFEKNIHETVYHYPTP